MYLFRHAAYRDVAYALQLPSERARLHSAAFTITEEEFADTLAMVAAELAEHARHARTDGPDEQADALAKAELRYLLMAIDRQNAGAQWDNLLRSADHALACPACSSESTLRVLKVRAGALQTIGHSKDALAAWRTLAAAGDEQDDGDSAVSGRCSAALILASAGAHDESSELIRQAEEIARESGDGVLLATVHMKRAMLCNSRGDTAETERLLQLALEVVPPDSGADIHWLVRGNLANLYANSGRREQAIESYHELLEVMRTRGDKQHVGVVLANLGRQYLVGGEVELAETYLLQANEIARASGNLRSGAFALANLATCDMLRGQFGRAEESIVRAIEIAREYGLVVYHAAYRCTWALLQLLQGHEQVAHAAAEEARNEFIAVNAEAYLPEFCSIVRLRIAVWQAVSEVEPGRGTSRLRAAPPSRSWLVVIRSLAKEIEKDCDTKGAMAPAALVAAADEARELVAEVAAAVDEDRPALVFRGYLPSQMRPELRRTLVERLSQTDAGIMKRLHPELWRALNEND